MRPRLQLIDVVIRLEQMFPGLRTTASALKATLRATRSFDYPEFAEPPTLLVLGADGQTEVEIDADLIDAWVGHMSHSSRLRMEILEEAVLRSLVNSEVIASATLARAHLEAAAWAAYAYEELLKVAETGSWARLRQLLPKMLYGRAIAREAKRLPPDERNPYWLEAASVMNAIDALDRFFRETTGQTVMPLRPLYAWLSDYAHPALRGVRHLVTATGGIHDGWTIAYSRDERLTAVDADLILSSLLVSMRFGHGASLLMRLGTIDEDGTTIRYLRPDPDDEMDVKRHVMFGDIPDD
jgi:hypothetical protein